MTLDLKEIMFEKLERLTDQCRNIINTQENMARRLKIWRIDRQFETLCKKAKPFPIDSGKFLKYTEVIRLYTVARYGKSQNAKAIM